MIEKIIKNKGRRHLKSVSDKTVMVKKTTLRIPKRVRHVLDADLHQPVMSPDGRSLVRSKCMNDYNRINTKVRSILNVWSPLSNLQSPSKLQEVASMFKNSKLSQPE